MLDTIDISHVKENNVQRRDEASRPTRFAPHCPFRRRQCRDWDGIEYWGHAPSNATTAFNTFVVALRHETSSAQQY
jgi:hypothetical protein